MLAEFKALTGKISKAYKKGQWNRFIISFLILVQLGMLAIADGWASPLEAPKTLINADKIWVAGAAGESVRDTTKDTVLETTRDTARDMTQDQAAEAAIFEELIQVSGTSLDRAVIYAWAQIPLPSDQNAPEAWSQNLVDHCQKKILDLELNPTEIEARSDLQIDKIFSQNKKTQSFLVETEQGELIKISIRRIAAANIKLNGETSFYLLAEVSQITSAERAVLLRQLVTQALAATKADVLADSIEPGSVVTNVIDSECIVSDGVEPDDTEANDIVAVPVKSSLNLTLSRTGHLTPAEQLKLVKQMLAAAGAGPSQGLNSSELISLTAYTPRLAGSETLAGEPVNLQMASRYHSLDNRTYFQIGAPLLMIEY